ncbi:hypothetical protein MMC25_007633 [Agyrium rufum]|nr:hypothetical protein [Agyrium rufum]
MAPKIGNPLSVDVRRRLYEQDAKWPLKTILRLAAAFLELLAMIMFAIAVSLTNKNFVNTEGPGDWTDGMALAPSVLGLIADPIILILWIVLRGGKPLNPAFALVLDGIMWILAIPSIIVAVGGALFLYWTSAVASADGTVNCAFFFNEFSGECDPIAYTIGRLEIAGIVFLVGILVLHLALFIFGTIDMHQKRQARLAADVAQSKVVELQ